MFRRLTMLGVGAGALGFVGLNAIPKFFETYNSYLVSGNFTPGYRSKEEEYRFSGRLPTRSQQLKRLENEEFDILVIGGGATGVGTALDAVSRGLKVAMVEKFDFASGTSSRSTKLIHGGVRYLQKAVFNLDIEQYRMVKEALEERANLVHIAPHLAYPLPIMLPIYNYIMFPYYWAGIKMYDVVSGSKILKSSYSLSKTRALELFPMLNKEELKGALVYYDGQQDDARMCLSIALTATRYGAAISNYVEVTELLKKPVEMEVQNAGGEVSIEHQDILCGARVLDKMSGREFNIRAKCIINATGPYTDFIRKLDNWNIPSICAPSSGVHIVLPGYYSPTNMGLLDPATKDGRIIFFLPWQNCTMAGTTDNPCPVTDSPCPSEGDVSFILDEIRHYLSPDIKVRRGDVHSAWCGIRPLVRDPNKKDTQSIARNHIIEVSPSRLVTIAGGKWTTYRHMAEEAVDAALETCSELETKNECVTRGLLLEGAHEWSPNLFIQLVQDFGMDPGVAKHLSNTYGSRAVHVAQMAGLTGLRWPVTGVRLHPDFPYLECEVRYACREYACRAVDIISRRTRLGFLNAHAAQEALPRIVDIMAEELQWDRKKKEEELQHCKKFLVNEMGMELKPNTSNVPINFAKDEINELVKRFHSIDHDKKGYISVKDLKRHFTNLGEKIDDATLRDILNEVDVNRNGEVDMGEFLQFMSALKTGAVANSRFKRVVTSKSTIDVTRSGGGV